MSEQDHDQVPKFAAHCCPCGEHAKHGGEGVSRRTFLGNAGGAALGGIALTGLTWKSVAAAGLGAEQADRRKPLVVQPIFLYSTYQRKEQTSWRPWGGIQTQTDADQEVQRIQGELAALKKSADFPIEILPLASVRNTDELNAVSTTDQADTVLLYAAGGQTETIDAVGKLGKDVIFFVRYRSGPVYLWYEIVSPSYLRQHTDELKVDGIDFEDVVVDSQEEILWRLRSLGGLHNTMGTRILSIGAPGGWAQPRGVVPELAKKRWNLDIRTITYDELGKLIREATGDQRAVATARHRAGTYLKLPGTTLETDRAFVDNAFLLECVFRALMTKADCQAMTINGCMTTIMPMSKTTACLPLSTLNDDGYLAFCESDFVVVPSGILLANISGRPAFLQDPTYPHNGIITLAHCTGPRKMDGKTLEPVKIMTHFESDYGAAPKVDMRKGQKVTMIAPDFKAERWMGLSGEIVDHPLLPICRSQIDVRFEVDSRLVAERMPGFHWMLVYGDYARETGYALKRTPIEWDYLG